MTSKIKIGDHVSFYCYTDCRSKVGTVTAIDVPIQWRSGLGVQIDGSLTRPYSDVHDVNAADGQESTYSLVRASAQS